VLHRYIDSIARTQLAARQRTIAQIRTREAAERRQVEVREKILKLIGGLPQRSGSVAVKEFGSISGDGFRMEKIAYESLPDFWVTANLYVPTSGEAPFPAIVLAPGHGAGGKTENWSWGGNFARNGIVTLAYDPIGQGERLQYYDTERKTSFIGNPTGEHGEANVGPMLLGDTIARYMVNDAMRGVDYLISRKDVDGARIGAFGCSGGGTMTAYFAALDSRLKAAATACYITSFEELLASPQGAQDAEQSIPHFIEQGMDFADWVEAFAPKPYAVVSTENDMFPFAGARATVDEAKRIYGLHSAADKLEWITGPGGHGNLGPISPAILSFFTKNLKNSVPEHPFTPMRVAQASDLIVTPTGQALTSLGKETVYSINRQRAGSTAKPPVVLRSKEDLQVLQARLVDDIRRLTGAAEQPGQARPVVAVANSERRQGYTLDTISLKSDGDTAVSGIVAMPGGTNLKRSAVLMLGPVSEARETIEALAKENVIVMALDPRPTPIGTESIKSPFLGVFNLLSLRAFLVGKTLVGFRLDDAVRAMDWIAARRNVKPEDITVYGKGPLGIVALHAAVVDKRISHVVLENTLTTYRMIIEQPVHRNVSEVVIPGVLRAYDTGDLLVGVSPRRVSILSPQDALGNTISEVEYRAALPHVFQSEERLRSSRRIRFASQLKDALRGKD
jgi:cephalosporin-C deacetylase-like acetyl esterase